MYGIYDDPSGDFERNRRVGRKASNRITRISNYIAREQADGLRYEVRLEREYVVSIKQQGHSRETVDSEIRVATSWKAFIAAVI